MLEDNQSLRVDKFYRSLKNDKIKHIKSKITPSLFFRGVVYKTESEFLEAAEEWSDKLATEEDIREMFDSITKVLLYTIQQSGKVVKNSALQKAYSEILMTLFQSTE